MKPLYNLQLFTIFNVLLFDLVASDKYVDLSCDGPIVLGATIHFNAHLYNSDGTIPNDKFTYRWKDDAIPKHSAEMVLSSPACAWNITYDQKTYIQGPYVVEVDVLEWYLFFWRPVISGRIMFNVTQLLNGKMELIQNKQIQSGNFIARGTNVTHDIELTQPDNSYVNKTATSIRTLWFVNCSLVGNTTGTKFNMSYNKTNDNLEIEAIMIVGSEKPTPPPLPPNTTTTTPKPTSTTSKPTTTTNKPSSTTKKLTSLVKRSILSTKEYNPIMCQNKILLEPELNKTYGYFVRNVTVLDAISNITISGNNWLKHGDLLKLQVNCKGSKPIRYCVYYMFGVHNATGNETCPYTPITQESCQIDISRYFRDEDQHTVLIIISNDVTTVVKSVAITIYKTIHHPQISVIVVPVAFSLVAVVLIVFGVAYYIQSRQRFIVEVADFDFGQHYSDMEYKTFYQRLKDAIQVTFIGTFFVHDSDIDEPVNDHTPSSAETSPNNGFKYGSMT